MASTASPIEAFLSEPRTVVLAGIRKDGRPHVSPNWFYWDGEKFYVSTTRTRVKYKIFSRDPRVELLIDDPTANRYVQLSGTVEVREDIKPELARFRAIRVKYGKPVPPDDELAPSLIAEDRVLLAITPAGPPAAWTLFGLG